MSEAKLEAKEARKALKAQKAEKRQAKREKSFLNKYFHHVDQGSTTGREIMAGLLICILCVCAIFMNMQLITSMMVSGPRLRQPPPILPPTAKSSPGSISCPC